MILEVYNRGGTLNSPRQGRWRVSLSLWQVDCGEPMQDVGLERKCHGSLRIYLVCANWNTSNTLNETKRLFANQRGTCNRGSVSILWYPSNPMYLATNENLPGFTWQRWSIYRRSQTHNREGGCKSKILKRLPGNYLAFRTCTCHFTWHGLSNYKINCPSQDYMACIYHYLAFTWQLG